MPPIRIRPLDPNAPQEITLVAGRMRATLVEVLGPTRGVSMYTLAWLADRVRQHLAPARAVLLAEDAEGEIVGHTILRLETDERQREHGLFSTSYVAPAERRRGVATLLLRRGEDWMREHGAVHAATCTSSHNHGLLALYRRHGYAVDLEEGEMVRLWRDLESW